MDTGPSAPCPAALPRALHVRRHGRSWPLLPPSHQPPSPVPCPSRRTSCVRTRIPVARLRVRGFFCGVTTAVVEPADAEAQVAVDPAQKPGDLHLRDADVLGY